MVDFKLFQKPQRYIGNEWNVKKKPHRGRIKICISYPALYEIGMSNLGVRIIYGLLNAIPDVVCERVFMPGYDCADFLRKNKVSLFSLETKTPLNKFEILGFNFNCEINFTNFLHILELGRIPLRAEERKSIIVMGGGIANPEPLAEFVDLFYIGEFEEVAHKFVSVLRRYKDKQERLKAFSEIEGFYVPKFYSFSLNNKRYVFEKKYRYAKFPIRKIYVKDIDKSYYPLDWLTPYISLVHDRLQIEIARGCPNRCTFCQARGLYYPYRERKISTIQGIIKKAYDSSGYEKLSFLALSASDYSSIEELIDVTRDYLEERKIGLSLPSLRVTDIVGRLYKKLISIRKTSLTVAVEVANERLRSTLNKRIDKKELFEASKILHSLKVKHIKVYFMYGFPEEGEEDLVAIGEFLKKLSKDSNLTLNVSINIFIPKPFSVWENVSMEDESILEQKREIILKNIPFNRNIKVSISHPKKSIVEAVIARGDRRLVPVIYRAFLKEVRLNSHREGFLWEVWENAFREEGLDYKFYTKANSDNFPWSFISPSYCR
jgi:radical SAM family uncharacterized protein